MLFLHLTLFCVCWRSELDWCIAADRKSCHSPDERQLKRMQRTGRAGPLLGGNLSGRGVLVRMSVTEVRGQSDWEQQRNEKYKEE